MVNANQLDRDDLLTVTRVLAGRLASSYQLLGQLLAQASKTPIDKQAAVIQINEAMGMSDYDWS